ncbi:DUF559 domain-containing protein [Microbacterium saccharophilum]|uniref:DUF559 domain-containing protein n=1 Tax=Microbacterium saccharophilum TaxID=1213358 RepID=A0A5C8I0H5_9MICO|nr:type IV toxin-antitoxin system AbiEi family antitoxin domain-containing protein [Microbacterium saccharophilum]TXK11330.1 DUF559 domain-containing protein [Microbacterium saccharophilum]
MPDAVAQVRSRGGVARTSTLNHRGVGRREVERLVQRGHLVRVKRGWVATPDADALLVSCARSNVVLTCVTQARRLGLWVLADDARCHVAAPAHAGRAPTATALVHWARPVVPRHPDALADPIENVLAAIAACQPFECALAVWESALQKGLVRPELLGRLALPASARRLLDEAEVWFDSGLETLVVPRLLWLGLPLRRQIWIHGHRVDLLIGDRLVLQVDGGHHVGAQRAEDNAHDAALMLLGYHVIRVGYGQVIDGWPEVQELIMRAVAQGLHRAPGRR